MVRKIPLKYAKSLTVTKGIEIFHFFDYESDEPIHVKGFQDTMDNLKKAEKLGKQIKYKSGYSNIAPIKRAFNEKFENMDEYKKEDNLKRCLNKMSLTNVVNAIGRARKIMQRNCENGYTLHQYRGYKYYKENPSLASWEAIERILLDCKLL